VAEEREECVPPSAGVAILPLERLSLDEATLRNSPVLPYVVMLAGLIERRVIGREELLAALRTSMRQRSMGRQSPREYVVCYLQQHPP
jgi:hypothetical protein